MPRRLRISWRAAPTLAVVAGLASIVDSGWAESARMEPSDLAVLDIEALMNVRVVSAAKKEQKLSQAAAAAYVVTQEDIRRSGVTSIPEALRLAPGVEVARLDANKWAISIRGFNDRFANKLLVLIDGRTVYTPLFSGVYWDVQDVLLEDIDRIEVIRGPGATLWGANAVNGVINIITKRAEETPGLLVTAGGGTEERAFGGARYGGTLGPDANYRVYFKAFDRDPFVVASGADAADDWQQARGGFRMDWTPVEEDMVTLQGDIYDGDAGLITTAPVLTPPFVEPANRTTDVAGGNILGRWSRALSDTSDMSLQVYYDRTERRAPTIEEERDTVDVDAQHRFAMTPRQEIIWGAGYRYTADDIKTVSDAFTVEPATRGVNLVNLFLQDEIQVTEDALRLIVGTKLEQNDYTGLEIQPNARMVWTPDDRQTLWGAVSRAVRTPSRAENDFAIDQAALPPGTLAPTAPAALARLVGNNDFDAEELMAYELGYRVMPTEKLSLDISTFYYDYDSLRSFESGAPFPEADPPPHLVAPLIVDNKMEGESYGAEAAVDWQLRPWWYVRGAYSYLQMQLHLDGDSTDTTSEDAEGESPEHQLTLRSSMDLPGDVELDAWLRYVDRLRSLDVDSYLTLDLRLAWSPRDGLELAVVGQNLLEDQHAESSSSIIGGVPSEVPRGVYGKITWAM